MNIVFSNTLKLRWSILLRKAFKNSSKVLIRLIPIKILRHNLINSLPTFVTQRNKKIQATERRSIFLVTNNTSNLGDLYCTPALYFNLSPLQEIYDIVNVFNANDKVLSEDKLIVGGGDHGWLLTNLDMQKRIKGGSNIAWGIGAASQHRISDYLLNKFDLIGVRNLSHPQIDNKKIFYVPCCSCFMNELMVDYPIKHKIVFYLHNWTETPLLKEIKSEYPYMDNYGEIGKAIEFLGSAEIVVSNSYHGIYWATLMNKKVIGIHSGPKFEGYKFEPAFATFENWKDKLDECRSYPDAMNDCRKINLDFYQKVIKIVSP